VHWAEDAGELVRAVHGLLAARGVRRVVKSKSMLTEECGLNPYLEARGIEVIDTDLGERIVQLAGEPPSHIIFPAIHKSAVQIGELFERRMDGPRGERDPTRLTHHARAQLRRRFLEAEAGISGVNFAVAETGTLVIVENEGNARLATSQPRVHIAVMGIEKVLPRLADLAVFLTLLPRAATGQRMSSYVSLLTGPRRRGERDGPEALHLVILDGGRSAIHADPVMRQALRCIRCGACLNVCPVFERTGGHAYGSVYSGPIGAVLTPLFRGMEEAGALPFASSLCGACGEICPVKIDLPGLLLELRARAVASGLAAIGETLFVKGWTAAALRAGRFALAGRMMRTALRWIGRRPGWVPYPMSKWMASRDLPASPRAAFRDRPQP
jgi:L-lactate dehydrogenase complex protein LldF